MVVFLVWSRQNEILPLLAPLEKHSWLLWKNPHAPTVEMAWAAHGPLKSPLTICFHGPVNHPSTFVFCGYCYSPLNFWSTYMDVEDIFFCDISCHQHRPLLEFVLSLRSLSELYERATHNVCCLCLVDWTICSVAVWQFPTSTSAAKLMRPQFFCVLLPSMSLLAFNCYNTLFGYSTKTCKCLFHEDSVL